MPRRGLRGARRKGFPYLLIAPSVVLLLAVTVFPLFFALKNSFYFWNLQMSPQPLGFIGFDNYKMALTSSVFTASLVNTLVLTVSGTILEVLLGLAVALLLCRALPGHEHGARHPHHADDHRADRRRVPVPLHVRPHRRDHPVAADHGRHPYSEDGAAGLVA